MNSQFLTSTKFKNLQEWIVNNWLLIIIVVLNAILTWYSVDYFKHTILSDWNSYVSIALKYSKGDFTNAINGYWSPLISWLTGIFIKLGFNYFTCAKIIFTASSLFNLASILFLLNQLNVNRYLKYLILISTIPSNIYFASVFFTPDLLSCSFILIYIGCLFRYASKPGIRNGAIIGIVGAISYFCKYYNFPFFILHFTLLSFILFIVKKNKNFFKFYIAGILTFFIISLPWIIAISMKYQEITFSTSSIYNSAKISPEWKSKDKTVEELIGILPPPNGTAFSAWEDPTYYPMKRWSPFASWDNLKYNMNNMVQNFNVIKYSIGYCSIFAYVIFFFSLFMIFRTNRYNLFYLLSISFIIFYPLGYLLIAAEERYFISFYYLLLIAGSLLTYEIQLPGKSIKLIHILLPLIICSTFIISSIKNLNHNFRIKTSEYVLEKSEQAVDKILPDNASFASNGYEIPMNFAMNSHLRFFGTPKLSESNEEVEDELKKNNIEYYMNIGKDIPLFLNGKSILFEDKKLEIRIFKLN